MNIQNLYGLRILNTRPLGQNKALSQTIRDTGAVSVELPAIAIEPTNDDWQKQKMPLSRVDQCIFISANAVQYYFTTPLHWPSHILVTTIGQASANALLKKNVLVHHTPIIENSEALLQMPHLQNIQNQTITLVKGEGGRPLIEETLSQRGACVTPLAVYRRVLPKIEQTNIDLIWQNDAIDIILFTSQEAMYNLFTLFGEKARSWLCCKPCVVISERLAQIAQAQGMQTIIVDHLKNGLNALVHYVKGQMNDNGPTKKT